MIDILCIPAFPTDHSVMGSSTEEPFGNKRKHFSRNIIIEEVGASLDRAKVSNQMAVQTLAAVAEWNEKEKSISLKIL